MWSGGETAAYSLADEFTPYYDELADLTAAARGRPTIAADRRQRALMGEK